MKQIKNVITAVALCAILSTNAKQVGKKTITNEPKPTPTPYVQPAPKPMPKPTPTPYYPEPQTGLRYTDILSSLKNRKPDSSDFSTLQKIKDEADRQMQQLQASVERKPSTQAKPATNTNDRDYLLQMKDYAVQLVYQYPISLAVQDFQITMAYTNDRDIFLEIEKQKQYDHVKFLIQQFIAKFPAANQRTTATNLFNAITQHPNFTQLIDQITRELGENAPGMIQEVRQDTLKMINKAWDDLY